MGRPKNGLVGIGVCNKKSLAIAPCHCAACLLTDSLAFGEDTALATAPAGFGEEIT